MPMLRSRCFATDVHLHTNRMQCCIYTACTRVWAFYCSVSAPDGQQSAAPEIWVAVMVACVSNVMVAVGCILVDNLISQAE